MNVILYSTGCPKCNILKKKLADAQIDYKVIEDVEDNKKVFTIDNKTTIRDILSKLGSYDS